MLWTIGRWSNDGKGCPAEAGRYIRQRSRRDPHPSSLLDFRDLRVSAASEAQEQGEEEAYYEQGVKADVKQVGAGVVRCRRGGGTKTPSIISWRILDVFTSCCHGEKWRSFIWTPAGRSMGLPLNSASWPWSWQKGTTPMKKPKYGKQACGSLRLQTLWRRRENKAHGSVKQKVRLGVGCKL